MIAFIRRWFSTKSARYSSRRFPTLTGFWLAASLFIVYTVVAAGVGLVFFRFTDLGREETAVEQRGGSGKVLSSEVKTGDAIPVAVVFTALAAGGWLLIPLKFGWDELTKNSDATRQELVAQADDRRAVAAKMRELVFDAVTRHFGPMLYCQRMVASWAATCLESSNPARTQVRLRLLYAVALYQDCCHSLRESGMPIILRSRASEEKAFGANMRLQQCLHRMMGAGADWDLELIHAISVDSPGEPGHISFAEFRQRLKGKDTRWPRLRTIAAKFRENCADKRNLQKLKDYAEEANKTLVDGLTEAFWEWYDVSQRALASRAGARELPA